MNKKKPTPIFLIWATFLFAYVGGLSLKIGNPVNNYIQTGEATLFTSTLPLGSITYYSISFATAMPTNILEGAVGVIGTSFVIERQHGWSLFVSQVNTAGMIL